MKDMPVVSIVVPVYHYGQYLLAPSGWRLPHPEVYCSNKYRPLTPSPDDLIEPVIRELRRTKAIRDDEQIRARQATMIRYANVMVDLDRPEALPSLRSYLADLAVGYCGRYGDSEDTWTDESFIRGERTAQSVRPRRLA